jgi:hypothetical protein
MERGRDGGHFGAAVNRAHGIAASAAKAKTPILPTAPATDLIRQSVFISMPLSQKFQR